MGRLVRQTWLPATRGIDLPRRDRQGGAFEAFIPDRLSELEFAFEGDVAADVADAERALVRLDHAATVLTNTEGVARLLLRAESVASSHIEGLRISPRRLLHEAAASPAPTSAQDPTAREVLANIDAMTYALENPSNRISIDRILEVHRRLMIGSPHPHYAGVLRTSQNWIGGNDFNPIGARFVPPPPQFVTPLLGDLCDFCNDDGLPAVAQAAVAHAQFETIHPFADGNGRTGRALIYMVLRRRGLAERTTPPISLALATQARTYIDALSAMRVVGPPANALAPFNRWIAIFATACRRAVDDAMEFEQRIESVVQGWTERLGPIRSDASALHLLRKLPAMPVIRVEDATMLLGRGVWAANHAVARLVDAGILIPAGSARRSRRFEARDIIDAFTALERRLASPDGDTRFSPPVRPVPARPKRARRGPSTSSG